MGTLCNVFLTALFLFIESSLNLGYSFLILIIF